MCFLLQNINANRRTRKSSGSLQQSARRSYKSHHHSSKESAISVVPSQSCPSPPVLQKHASPRRRVSGQSSRNRQGSGSHKGSIKISNSPLLPLKYDLTSSRESFPVPEKEEKISITNNLQGILLNKKETSASSKSNKAPETYSSSQFEFNKIVSRKKPSPEHDTYQDARFRPKTKDISCDDSEEEDSDCMILETSPKHKSWSRQEKPSKSSGHGSEYKHKQNLISGIYRPKLPERSSGHKQQESGLLLALSPPALSEPSNSEEESGAETGSDSGSASSDSSSEDGVEEARVTASNLERLSSASEEKEENTGSDSSSDESVPPPLLEPQVIIQL